MLDLSIYKKRFFEIKLEGGTTIKLPSPKKKMLKKMLSLTEKPQGVVEGAELDAIYRVTCDILNSNKEGLEFTEDQIEDMFDPDVIGVFFAAYYEWVGENTKN